MIEILSDFPTNILAVRAHGSLTANDYRKVLEPAVNERMRAHRPLRFSFHLGEDYDGIQTGAVMEDARVGFSRWKDWGAIAVVTDSASVREVVGFFALFFHHPVRVFFDADYDKARGWICADEVRDVD